MDLTKEQKQERILLINYWENSFPLRGNLLKIIFTVLDKIETNSWTDKFNDDEKRKVRSMVQISIISNLMMYIEDLAVIAESFKQGKNFYNFLDKKTPTDEEDLGKIIENFLDNIGNLANEDIHKIMSYADPTTIEINGECKILLTKHIQVNTDETRRVLKEINDFGKSNHTVFRRFKHAGLPIFLGLPVNSKEFNFFSGYDSTMLVSKGKNPLEDVIPIPFSKQVLEGYKIIIGWIQTILTSMIKNRIECIERGVNGVIPYESYSIDRFTKEEQTKLKKKINEFQKKNPEKTIPKLNIKTQVDKKDIQWYLDLPKFITKSKERLKKETKIK